MVIHFKQIHTKPHVKTQLINVKRDRIKLGQQYHYPFRNSEDLLKSKSFGANMSE